MDAGRTLTTLTRLGFGARGLLYIIIAVLLIRLGRSEDPSGALTYLAAGGGRLLMIGMALGFLAYGLWRASDALFNIERHENGAKGLRERLAVAASGVVHLLLAWQAVRLIRGFGAGTAGGSQAGAETALALPGGSIVPLLAGLILVGVGISQFIKAAKCSYLRHLEPGVAGTSWAKWTGRAGYAARGLVFVISGYFLLRAGLESDPGKPVGMQDVLSWLSRPWDLLVALGLLGFGLYSLIEARFRIIHEVHAPDLPRNPIGR